MGSIKLDDSIAALATPLAESALAIIRTSGKDCIELLNPVFQGKKPLFRVPGGRIVTGLLANPAKNGDIIDQVTAAVFRGPHSYTGENTVEIFAHGGPAVIGRILEMLSGLGFRQAEPGEFTLRAFLNGRMDLTRAEAVRDIISAKTRMGVSLALGRLGGSVEKRITALKGELLDITAKVEVQLDYPEGEDGADDEILHADDLQPIIRGLKDLAETYSIGSIYRDGIKMAIAGKTNAGKSSLFNLFLREDRAIVSPIHGTTRDYLESWISLDGIPVSLYDTAGLRESGDPLEQEGMRRTRMVIEDADIILHITDGSAPHAENDDRFSIAQGREERVIHIWNKTDIADRPAPEGFIGLSTKTFEGFKILERAVLDLIRSSRGLGTHVFPHSETPVIDSLRQKELLDRAAESLNLAQKGLTGKKPLDIVSQDLSDALRALGEITGEITTEDILSAVFSRFCVGK